MTCSANTRHKSERNHLSLFWTQFQFTNGPGCHPSTAYARWVRPPGWFFLPPARARGERVKFGASRFLDGRGARPHLGRGGCLHGTRGYILLALELRLWILVNSWLALMGRDGAQVHFIYSCAPRMRKADSRRAAGIWHGRIKYSWG
jgi:hypothetical protein